MKKTIAIVLVLTMVFAFASSALAGSTDFNIVTESTNILQVGTSLVTRARTQWYVVVNMATSNVSPTHRAVTRVHKGASVASATWVYSGANDTPHPYSSSYPIGTTGLSYRGRLDNRDSGLLEFHGTWNY